MADKGNGESAEQFGDSMNVKFAGNQADLAQILDDIHAFLRRFVIYPSKEAHDAHVLWIVHTHLMDAWESTPRIAFLSPEPASGKTRALEVSELLVPNPVEAVNVSPAYLFRKVGSEDGPPTILFDEIDTIFGPKAKENEEIRGLLNAGHRKGAVAGRCVVRGKTVTTEEISAYCAVALAGLGWLPDTILTRSVIIRMRRRAPHEKVTPFRRRVYASEGNKLRDQLAAWAAKSIKDMTEARPEMPDGIEDRSADVWEALLAVAEAAGEHWPKRACVAAVALVAAMAEREPSLGIRLLSDLRDIRGQTEQMTTAVILDRLHSIQEAPWNDLKGKPLNDRGLAYRLREYGVKSRNHPPPRDGGGSLALLPKRDQHERSMRPLAALLALALVALAITAATGMGVMVRATGPYNITCEEFAKAKPAQRERALAFAQGYFAAQNMELDVDSQIDLQERWRELNTYITRACTDKSNPYLHRRFVNDAADEAFEKMGNRKRQLPTTN